MERLKHFSVGKVKYPYKCDLLVLEKLQETFWNIFDYEMELKGLELMKDEAGNTIYNEDGTPNFKSKHFSFKALNAILPLMVNEGLEIEAHQQGKDFTPVDDKEFIRSLVVNPYELHSLVVEEFNRCFATKK